ncbi:hypothetical protein H0N95_02150, partial [Candidatus Micrarchaeota archaeon]|nr:hypothetical protein [Candidatus Micrarchaeota archaeon]
PTAVAYVLSSKYDVNFSSFGCYTRSLEKLPEKYKLAIVQAFFDDEGYVHDSNIQICSANKKMLLFIKRTLENVHIHTGKLGSYRDYYRKDNSISKVFYFCVLAESVSEFKRLVGFVSPKKKQYLDLILKIRKRGKYTQGNVREIILNELANGPRTAREISLKAIITAYNLRKCYLYPLEKEEKIKRFGKKPGKGGGVLWCLQ